LLFSEKEKTNSTKSKEFVFPLSFFSVAVSLFRKLYSQAAPAYFQLPPTENTMSK